MTHRCSPGYVLAVRTCMLAEGSRYDIQEVGRTG
jgi:hypothetical protein